MEKTNLDIFKEFYPKLLEILPVDSLLNHLFSKQLLSGAQKDRLRDIPTNRERVKYFLDEVVERGLKIGFMDQFDEVLAVMANSDDPTVKFLAKEMMKSRGNVPPKPIPILNDQIQGPQAIPQNTETQNSGISDSGTPFNKATGSLNSVPDFRELKKKFEKVADWESVCPYLLNDDDGQTTQDIKRNGGRIEMIQRFLRESNPTWKRVIEALRNGNYRNLADVIEKELKG